MEFRLSYRGELKGNGDPQHKHSLRRHFHAQLSELWKQAPLASRPDLTAEPSLPNSVSLSMRLGAFRFVPLVSSKLHGVAELDVVMLRPGAPGKILKGGGDIDNRLKTLLDALKVPDNNALPAGCSPQSGEDPFYCLLEDDKLVTAVRLEADRLLDAKNDREVLLLIWVHTKHTEAIWANLGL